MARCFPPAAWREGNREYLFTYLGLSLTLSERSFGKYIEQMMQKATTIKDLLKPLALRYWLFFFLSKRGPLCSVWNTVTLQTSCS